MKFLCYNFVAKIKKKGEKMAEKLTFKNDTYGFLNDLNKNRINIEKLKKNGNFELYNKPQRKPPTSVVGRNLQKRLDKNF